METRERINFQKTLLRYLSDMTGESVVTKERLSEAEKMISEAKNIIFQYKKQQDYNFIGEDEYLRDIKLNDSDGRPRYGSRLLNMIQGKEYSEYFGFDFIKFSDLIKAVLIDPAKFAFTPQLGRKSLNELIDLIEIQILRKHNQLLAEIKYKDFGYKFNDRCKSDIIEYKNFQIRFEADRILIYGSPDDKDNLIQLAVYIGNLFGVQANGK